MHPDLDSALCRDFPSLYRDRHRSATTTSMCFGFSVGDGWEPIIRRLSERLEPLVIGTNVRASQVKDKFGSFRFYLHGRTPTKEMERAIEEAEREARRTCPRCGATGPARWRPNVSSSFDCARCGYGIDDADWLGVPESVADDEIDEATFRASLASVMRRYGAAIKRLADFDRGLADATGAPTARRVRTRRYTCVVLREGNTFSVSAPGIPGVFGLGSSPSIAQTDFAEAIGTLLDYLNDVGEPEPSQGDVQVVTVDVEVGADAEVRRRRVADEHVVDAAIRQAIARSVLLEAP
jgi:predicted RNase H-like HicB family nuclease